MKLHIMIPFFFLCACSSVKENENEIKEFANDVVGELLEDAFEDLAKG